MDQVFYQAIFWKKNERSSLFYRYSTIKYTVYRVFFQKVMIGEWHIMSTNCTQNVFSPK